MKSIIKFLATKDPIAFCKKGILFDGNKMPRLTDALFHVHPIKKFTNYKYVPLDKQLRPKTLHDYVSGKRRGGSSEYFIAIFLFLQLSPPNFC